MGLIIAIVCMGAGLSLLILLAVQLLKTDSEEQPVVLRDHPEVIVGSAVEKQPA